MSSAPHDPKPPELAPCSRSGHCCRGQGRTPVTEGDLVRLAKHLHQPVEAVRFTQLRRDPDGFILKTKNPVFTEAECVFLGEGGCTVYDGRPEACRTWPLWPRLYEDAAVYEKSRATCAMIRHLNHGAFKELYSRRP